MLVFFFNNVWVDSTHLIFMFYFLSIYLSIVCP